MCWYAVWLSRKGGPHISREQSWECWGCSLPLECGRTGLSQCVPRSLTLPGNREGIPHFGAVAWVSGTMVGVLGILFSEQF